MTGGLVSLSDLDNRTILIWQIALEGSDEVEVDYSDEEDGRPFLSIRSAYGTTCRGEIELCALDSAKALRDALHRAIEEWPTEGDTK